MTYFNLIFLGLKKAMRALTFLGFYNWFNPAMLRELATKTQRTQSFSFLRDLRDSVAKFLGNPFGKGVLPTSCRFNDDLKIRRLQIRRLNLSILKSFNLLIALGALHQTSLAKFKRSEKQK